MTPEPGKIIIVGGGIAGLCAAVYARQCGYKVELFEKHDSVGGLATSWRRGEYTFETCLHWLLGSKPGTRMHERWQEVFDIDRLQFVDPAEFVRIESERGEELRIYTDADRLERELLDKAPQDTAEIRHLMRTVRRFAKIELPELGGSWPQTLRGVLRALPDIPVLRSWAAVTSGEYGARFSHPLLRAFFGAGEMSELSAIAVVFALAWLSDRNAGYPIGGSRAITSAIADKAQKLGARLHLGTAVRAILVERGNAIGVDLGASRTEFADWVISAADGHETIYELLGGRYHDAAFDPGDAPLKPYPSYVQVSFGVARDLSARPGFVTRVLDAPFVVDPGTRLERVSFRIFNFDPSFAPQGKTAITCVLPTRNAGYWADLRRRDPDGYAVEKRRVAGAVAAVMDRVIPGAQDAIEVTDVSTPATVMRLTSNWNGSMEGWLLSPASGLRPLPATLEGLRQFLMIGQWRMPGGGLPSGLMTARAAVQAICRHDRESFAIQPAA